MSTIGQKPTQKDVAELAGVSTATVSRVLNNQQPLTNEAKAKVLHAVETLNYVPHASARALAMNRSGTLGAIIPTLNNAIFAEGINAFEAAAQQRGYTLLLSVSQQDLDTEQALVLKMIERGVDGLLLVGNRHQPSVFDRLRMANMKHVCTWAFELDAAAPNIGFDNALAMHDIIDYLVSLGHRRIAMLAGQTQSNDRASERIRGVRERLAVHGIELLPQQVLEVPYSVEASSKVFHQLLESAPTAVVCGNDVIAYGVLLEAQRLGISVPDQLSVTGFDDLALSSQWSPALTTVAVEATKMGQMAAEQLINAVEGNTVVGSKKINTRLIVRGTCAQANPNALPGR